MHAFMHVSSILSTYFRRCSTEKANSLASLNLDNYSDKALSDVSEAMLWSWNDSLAMWKTAHS